MKEEDIIRKHLSGRTPFRTPEGYFESFNSRLMQRIAQETAAQAPQPKVASMHKRTLRIFRYAAAAVLTGLCIAGGTYLWNSRQADASQALSANTAATYSEEYIDAALDYEMINNRQIAYYLTEAY